MSSRILAAGIVALAYLGVGVCPVCAQKLEVKSGSFAYSYIFASQSGPNGFFGPYNIDNSSQGGKFAPLNGWLGQTMVSGSDAGYSQIYLNVIPQLTLNEAVKVGGTYRIGPYFSGSVPGATDPISTGNWLRLGIYVATPLGRITYGKLQFAAGNGLQFSLGNRTIEALLLETYYAVALRLTNADLLYLATNLLPEEFNKLSEDEQKNIAEKTGETPEDLKGWATNPESVNQESDSMIKVGFGVFPWRQASTLYWQQQDLNAANTVNVVGYVSFTNGPVQADILGFYNAYHEGPESQQNVAARRSTPPLDNTTTEGLIFFRYDRGTFFAFFEADWYYRTVRYQSSLDGTFYGVAALIPVGGGSMFAPQFVESWRWMIGAGGLIGPLQWSLMYAHMPGPDRRHGILIDRQPYIQESQQSAVAVFDPYSNLMAATYSSGVNSFSDMNAADSFAGRIDYALAANLLLGTSLIHARRSSYGYSWGYLRPNPAVTATYGSIDYAQRGTFLEPTRAIPENNLGWEVNAGLKWRFLDNWDFNLRVSYWWPGKWFNYACIDKSVPNWDIPTRANNFGINPNRKIYSVFSLSMTFSAGF